MPGCGPCGKPIGVHGDVAAVDPFAGHEITFRVVDDLIRVYVRVVVRCRDPCGMIVKQARHKRAHDKIMRLERFGAPAAADGPGL